LLKVLPIAVLVYVAYTGLRGPVRLVMVVALLCSGSGDALLELGIFVPGLAAFLLAQLLYAGQFFSRRNWHALAIPRIALVIVALVSVSLWMLPYTGNLRLSLANW